MGANTMTAAQNTERIKVRPTLLLGLGGTGGDILLRVRKRFFEKYGSLDEFQVVSYLWVDTDITEKEVIAREFTDAVAFRDPERVMTIIDSTAAITDHLDDDLNLRHIHEWWHPGLNSVQSLRAGAGQVRAYSRLGFFHWYDRPGGLRGALSRQGDRIRDPKLKDATLNSEAVKRAGGIDFDTAPGINVYLISSLAGGTGSGIFLDTAFLVKNLYPDAHLLAYLLLPRFFGDDKKMDANGYAALKELNYYSTAHFRTQWDPQLSPVTVPPPPFDYCYLLDSRNMAGEVTGGTAETREAVLEMLADSVFKDFTHGGFADQKRRCRVNIGPRLTDPLQIRSEINGLEFTQSLPVRYQSLGQASIVMPHDRIITACAYQLGADVVAYWSGLSGSDFPVALLTETVRTRILPHPAVSLSQDIHRGAQQNQILERLGREATGSGQLVSKVDSWSKEIADRVLQGVPAKQRKSYRPFLEQEIEQEKNLFIAEERHANPANWGDFSRAIHDNGEALKKTAALGIQNEIFRLIDEEQYSVAHAAAILRQIAFVLKDSAYPYLAKFEQDAQNALARIPKAEQGYKSALDALARHERRSNWDGRKHTIIDYDLDCWRNALVGTPRDPGYFRLVLLARINRAAAALCRGIIEFIEGKQLEDGRVEGGLVQRLERLGSDLDGFRARMNKRLGHFRDNRPADLSLLLYSASEFDGIYTKYAGTGEDRTKLVKEMSEKILANLNLRVTGLPALAAGDQSQKLEDAILAITRGRFERVRQDYHVVTEFDRKYPKAQRVEQLKRMKAKSAAMIYGVDTYPSNFRFQNGTQISVVGVPMVPLGLGPAETSRIETARQELISLLQAQLGVDSRSIFDIPETSEIIFYNEVGAFPVCYISETGRLRDNYTVLSASERLHTTCHDRKFADLRVMTPEDLRSRAEAGECFALGRIFGVIAPRKTGQTVNYFWTEKIGLNTFQRNLGDQQRAIDALLVQTDVRRKLLSSSAAHLAAAKASKDALLPYYAVLNFEYNRLTSGKDGAARRETELDFEDMIMVRVLRARISDAEQAALVPGIGFSDKDAFDREAEICAAKLSEFTVLLVDGARMLQPVTSGATV